MVQVIKDGRIIPENREKTAILNGEYDTIRIILNNPSIYAGLPEWIKKQQFIETILHELLHIKHPEWDEEKIRDESARIIGEDLEKIVTGLEKITVPFGP